MAWIHATHPVEDYDAWKSVFDSIDDVRRKFDWKQSMVFHTDGAPNELTVMEEFGSASKARDFLESDELRTAMKEAGVQGRPEMHVLRLHAHERATVSK